MSMAGLADSVLGVRGGDALADAVREVWASIASGRALAYLAAHGRARRGDGRRDPAHGAGAAAGVMFTRCAGRPIARRAGRADHQRGLRARRARRRRRHHAGRAPHRRARAPRRLDRRAQDARDGRSAAAAWRRSPVDDPDRPALSPRARRRAGRDRGAPREARPRRRGTSSSRATTSARGSCRRAPPPDAAFPTAATPAPCGATSTSARRCPASRRRSRGPSPAPSARPASAARSRRSAAASRSHARLVGNVHGRFYLNLTQFMRIAAQVPFLDPRTLVELGGGWGGDELATQVEDVRQARLLRAPAR